MDMALAGQILGRILVSYLVVVVVMFLFSRFDIKRAFYHTHRWYGFIILVFIFLAGISSRLYN